VDKKSTNNQIYFSFPWERLDLGRKGTGPRGSGFGPKGEGRKEKQRDIPAGSKHVRRGSHHKRKRGKKVAAWGEGLRAISATI